MLGIFRKKKEADDGIDRNYYVNKYLKALYETTSVLYENNQRVVCHTARKWRMMGFDFGYKALKNVKWGDLKDNPDADKILDSNVGYRTGVMRVNPNNYPEYHPGINDYMLFDLNELTKNQEPEYDARFMEKGEKRYLHVIYAMHNVAMKPFIENTLFYANDLLRPYLTAEELVGYFFLYYGKEPVRQFQMYIDLQKENLKLRKEDLEAEIIFCDLFKVERPHQHVHLKDSSTAIKEATPNLYARSEFLEENSDYEREL